MKTYSTRMLKILSIAWIFVFVFHLRAEEASSDGQKIPTVLLSFDSSLAIDSVYIYPHTVGIRPTASLAAGTRAKATFSNVYESPTYEHTSVISLESADPAFWLTFPADCPKMVAVHIELLNAAEQDAAANP